MLSIRLGFRIERNDGDKSIGCRGLAIELKRQKLIGH